MAKRDRKASGDVNDDLEVDVDLDASDTGELRPSGKRSARGRRGAATAVAERTKSTEAVETSTGASRNPFVKIWVFLKQVIAELRKVIWPTRSELVNYSIIVFVFVVLITAFIAGLDIGFAKLILLVFG
ncbi:preprotein translocase subunit SecE [Gordonia sp. (in: high G+C Gram-positive bacteria)]|uniref:preprotein translocase subunit SecE n=1 Tax=Gordonia sp. (in: high G+C Gram-positive bacteria) TaxID=84139 RepID=UPI0016BCA3DA|nr:preprotein translocase subunit SecE [Gordonia sp. (in: high G+C Gram-positive bacteria)]NLG47553.1 preprotein translocase subunit SecE [Gordonia sp. (in: high G+C Gram-positive bacteria)]